MEVFVQCLLFNKKFVWGKWICSSHPFLLQSLLPNDAEFVCSGRWWQKLRESSLNVLVCLLREWNNSDKIRNANVKPALSGIYAWCREHQQLTAQSANEVIEIVWRITGWPWNILSHRQEEESELWTSLFASASQRGIPSKSPPHKKILISQVRLFLFLFFFSFFLHATNLY